METFAIIWHWLYYNSQMHYLKTLTVYCAVLQLSFSCIYSTCTINESITANCLLFLIMVLWKFISLQNLCVNLLMVHTN